MGSIPGPIIKFRFDPANVQQVGRQMTSSLQSQFQAAGKNVSANFARSLTTTVGRAGKQTAEQFASAWATAAAKLRSQLSTEKLGLNQIVAARQRIISLAKSEADTLARKGALSKSELSTLKAATLEMERQKSFLSGTGGLTSGTRSVVQQILQGVTARAGSYGGGFGSFAGLKVSEPLGKFAEEAAGLNLALLGTGTAAVAATVALVALAKRGAEFAVSIRNTAEAAGISIKNTVELQSAAKVVGVDFDTVARGFKKFDEEITLALGASLPHASIQAKRAADIFQILGVNVEKAAQDPVSALQTLSKTLGSLPDGAVKSYTANQLLGRGYQDWLPVLNRFDDAINATKGTSDALADKIGGAAKVGDTLAATTANLSNQWHILETSLATVFVPMLTDIIGLINGGFSGGRNFFQLPGARVPRDINGNPINVPSGDTAFAERAMNGGAINLGKNPGALSTPDKVKALIAAEAMDSTGGGGRKTDFSEPLYLGTALEKEWKKYQEAITKSNEALKKHLDLMAKLNAATFAQNSFMTMMLGPIGIAADSPDKTGARIVEANRQAAQKIKDDQVAAMHQIIDAWQQWHDKGESLFQSLLSGGKNFAHQLVSDIEGILLKPVSNIFGNVFGNLLQNLSKIIPSGTAAGKTATANKGGILGKIAETIGKLTAPPKDVQQAIQTIQSAQIAAQNVYINGAPIIGSNLPKPTGNPFLSSLSEMFGGSSLSSLAGIGGMSIALAGAGGMAVAGSGGSPIATAGGVINAAGGAGTLGSLKNSANAMAANPLGTAVSGGILLGAGIANRNGAAMALGIGQLAGAGLTQLSKMLPLQGGGLGTAPMPSQLSNVLGVLGQAAPGIGMVFAGNQTGGFGGAAMGALGGAEAGAAIGSLFGPGPGTAIGAGIGAVAGAIMGIFGKKDNTKAWNNGVQKAMNNQRITQPLSENFAFAATNAMASTFGTTFSQGPGGFSNSTLPANTPFWANAILGTPHGTSATIAWNALMNGINPNSPFFGGTNTSPFNGGPLVNGLRLPGAPTGAFSPNSTAAPMPAAPSVAVHLTIPGYVDKNGVADIAKAITPHIQRAFNKSIYQQSSGAWKTIQRAGNLP